MARQEKNAKGGKGRESQKNRTRKALVAAAGASRHEAIDALEWTARALVQAALDS